MKWKIPEISKKLAVIGRKGSSNSVSVGVKTNP